MLTDTIVDTIVMSAQPEEYIIFVEYLDCQETFLSINVKNIYKIFLSFA